MSREDKKNMTPEERKKERTLFCRQTLIPLIIIVVNFSIAMGILYASNIWGKKKYEGNALFNDDRVPVEQDGKWYALDDNGEIRSEGFSAMSPYRYRAAAVRNDENKWGYIDINGDIIVQCIYDEAEDFSESGVAVVKKDGEYFYIDRTGAEKFGKRFISARGFGTNRVARVENAQGAGLINTDGEYVVEPGEYSDIGDVSIENGYVAVKNHEGLWGYLNSNGEITVECKYNAAYAFKEGCAMVKNETGLIGFVNKDGEEIVPCQYTVARDFSVAQYAAVCNSEGRWGFVSNTGKMRVECQFADCLDFTNDESAAVRNDEGKWGYINNKGEFIIECQYTAALPVSNDNMAAVRKENEKWIYINRSGKQVIDAEYDSASTFAGNGIAVVGNIINEEMQYAIIDKDGNVRVDFGKYATLKIYNSGEILGTSADGKYTFIGADGTVIIEDIENFKPAGGVVEMK